MLNSVPRGPINFILLTSGPPRDEWG